MSKAVFTANHLTDTDKQNSTIHKLNTTQKATTQNTAEHYHGSVASDDTRPGPGNKTGLFYKASKSTRSFLFPDQQSGIHCLITCKIQLLTLNILGRA